VRAKAELDLMNEELLGNLRQAIDADKPVEAEQWLAITREAFPALIGKTRLNNLEQQLQDRSDIFEGLKLAQNYLLEDVLDEPAGENALDAFRAVLELEPDNASALAGINNVAVRFGELAENERLKGNFADALALLERGLAIKADDAELLAQQYRVERSRKSAQQEQVRNRKISEQLAKADSYLASGKLTQPKGANALESYRDVLKLDPGNSKAREGLKKTEAAFMKEVRSVVENGTLSEAKPLLRKADKLFPNSMEVAELLQNYESRMRELQAAKQAATRPKVSKFKVATESFNSMSGTASDRVSQARTLYYGFSFENFESATSLLQVVLYDAAKVIKLAQKPVVVTGRSGEGYFSISRPVEGYPEGSYHVDLMLNGKQMYSQRFTVGR
jgi:tetratricopeptide (TPR) repeat protein